MLLVSIDKLMERIMQLRTVCLLALIVVPASLSGSAASHAPFLSPPAVIQGAPACASVVPDAAERNICGRPIVIAQTPREQCIKTCQIIYDGGEPLKTCISKCPPQ
jgi:hypothetical protein